MGEIPSWMDWLYWLRTAGLPVVFGWLMSNVLERWDWFQRLPKVQKGWMALGLSLGIPIFGTLLACLSGGLSWGWAETWWPAIYSGFAWFAASQASYWFGNDG
jgi:hypothetical protein